MGFHRRSPRWLAIKTSYWVTTTNFMGFHPIPRFRAYLGASRRLLCGDLQALRLLFLQFVFKANKDRFDIIEKITVVTLKGLLCPIEISKSLEIVSPILPLFHEGI